jgi:hypothetical protein
MHQNDPKNIKNINFKQNKFKFLTNTRPHITKHVLSYLRNFLYNNVSLIFHVQ